MKTRKILIISLCWQLIMPPSLLFAGKSKEEEKKELEQGIADMEHYINVVAPMNQQMQQLQVSQGPAEYGLRCTLMEAAPSEAVNICPDNPSPADISQAVSHLPWIRTLISEARKNKANYKSDSLASGNIAGTMDEREGVECLNKESQRLQKDLDQRVTKIDALVKQMEIAQKKFNDQTHKPTVKLLEDKYNELFQGKGLNYENRFKSPQCQSIHTAKQFDRLGKKGGYENILNETQEIRDAADTLVRDKLSIEQDIMDTINRAATSASSSGVFEFANGQFEKDFSIGSDIVNTQTYKDAVQDLSSRYKKYFEAINKKVKSVLGSKDASDQALLSALTGSSEAGDAVDIDAALRNWQYKKEEDCLYSSFQGGKSDFYKAIASATDPGVSRDLRSSTQVNFENDIKRILSDPDVGIVSKVRQIRDLLKTNPNYEGLKIRLSSSYRGKSPNHYWSILDLANEAKNECYARMKSSKFGTRSGVSLAKSIQTVKQAAGLIKKAKNEFNQKFRTELKAKLYDCAKTNSNMSDINTSCSMDNMATSGKNFCFKNAMHCGSNTQACLGVIKQKFEDGKEAMKTAIASYNKKIEMMANQQFKVYEQISGLFENEAKYYQEKYNVSFKTPELSDPSSLKEGDSIAGENKLNIKEKLGIGMLDPKDMLKSFKKNTKTIISSVEKQNKEIMATVKKYVAEVEKNYKSAAKEWEKIEKNCNIILSTIAKGQEETGEHVNLCDGSEVIKSYPVSDIDQVSGIIKSLEAAGYAPDTDTTKDMIANYKGAIPRIKKLLEGLKEENRSLASENDDNESNKTRTSLTPEEIAKACTEVQQDLDINCENVSTIPVLESRITRQMQTDMDTLLAAASTTENLPGKICKNQMANTSRFDGKSIQYGNGGGGLVNDIFKTIFSTVINN